MKHCKNCEYCNADLVSRYIHGFDYYQCSRTGEHISEPFWDKCENYKRNSLKQDNSESFLFELVKRLRK